MSTFDLDPRKMSDRVISSLLHSKARLNIWEGSVRSTKTITSILRWLEYVKNEAPPGDLYMVGKTRDTLKRNILRPMEEIVGKQVLKYSVQAGEGRLFGKPLVLIGAANEAAETRLRGGTAAGAYCDELTTFPASAFKMLLSRMSLVGAKLFGTTNPDSPYHWLKTDYLDKAADLDLMHFHFTLDDNPWLPAAYKAALKAEYGIGTLWYKRFIDGLWVVAEGAIYDMWDESRHVTKVLPDPADVAAAWSGIDYGTNNPFVALLLLAVMTPKPHLVVASEWRWDSHVKRRQLSDVQYAREMKKWLTEVRPLVMEEPGSFPDGAHPAALLERIYVDPSAASFMIQCFNDGFPNIAGADNRVLERIRSVSSLLSQDKLLFHESCVGTRKEMPAYSWDEKAQEKGEDKPLKRDDHGPDAAGYGIQSERQRWSPWLRVEGEDTA